jgi:hypothetical protein
MGKPSRKRRNPLRQTTHHSTRTLIPHTGAWFEAMLWTDTMRALYAGAIVNQAGHLEVCTACGDTPAPVYDDLEAPFLPVRLCADCVELLRADGARLQRRPTVR